MEQFKLWACGREKTGQTFKPRNIKNIFMIILNVTRCHPRGLVPARA